MPRPHLELFPDVDKPYPVQMLVKLSVLATMTTLPWCNVNSWAGGDVAYLHAWRAWVQLQGPGNSQPMLLYDCENLWPQVDWGHTGKRQRPVAASNGTDIFAAMEPSWAPVNVSTGFYAMSTGTGFAAYPALTAEAVARGVDTVVTSASVQFDAYVSSELATADYTATLAGAFIAMSLTLVAIIAGYLARRELLHFFWLCRAPAVVAKGLAIMVTIFALVTYPVTIVMAEQSARADNPEGTETTVRWVQGDAAGVGFYKVVGAVTMTSTAVYDPLAYALIWANLAMAIACTLAICTSYYWIPYGHSLRLNRLGFRFNKDVPVEEPDPVPRGNMSLSATSTAPQADSEVVPVGTHPDVEQQQGPAPVC